MAESLSSLTGGRQNQSKITASGTWTRPAATRFLMAIVIAGGQGGGNDPGSSVVDGGGGGGVSVDVIPAPSDLTINIGAGGAGVASGNNTTVGAEGGDTEIRDASGNILLKARGGGKSTNPARVPDRLGTTVNGGQGGVGDNPGDGTVYADGGTNNTGGGGGASMGPGGNGNFTVDTKAENGSRGGGGGGSVQDGGGGDGGPGEVILMWSE